MRTVACRLETSALPAARCEILSWLTAGFALFALAACDASRSTDSATELADVRLDRTALILDEGSSTRLEVLAGGNDSPRQVNADVAWNVSDPEVLSVADGLVTALRAGTGVVTAVVSGRHAASASVEVVSVPGSIEVLRGDRQAGIVDTELPGRVQVRVLSRVGVPVRNTEIEFALSEGAGTVTPVHARTDGDGIAETTWKLGTRSGDQALEVKVVNRADLTARVVAQAAPGALTYVEITPTDALTGPSREIRFEAHPRDGFGNAVENAEVSWRALDPAVARITTDGVATAIGEGATDIEATVRQVGGALADESVSSEANPPVSSSTRFRVQALAAAPGQVTDLRVASAVGTTVSLHFTEVGDGSGSPASYEVRYRKTPMGSNFASAARVTSGSCRGQLKGTKIGARRGCKVLGLQAGQSYDFQMVAYRGTIATSGPLSNVATANGAPVNPGKVTNLSVTATSDSSATLRFTEVNDGAGQPAKYEIRFYAGAIGWNWGGAIPASKGTCGGVVAGTGIGVVRTCTVNGLQASTRYDFQLVAYRGMMNQGAVYGPLSNVATGTTKAGSGAGSGSLAISPEGGTLNAIGATLQLSATAKNANGGTISNPGITWSSSNTAVATVDASGRVTAKKVGSAVIGALAACCSADQVTVNVQPQVASISLSQQDASLPVNGTVQLTATARDANGNALPGSSFTWKTSNSSVASVNASGLVTGKAAGSASITANSAGKSASASVTVTAPTGGTVFFTEDFENGSFSSRGWYGNTNPVTTTAQHATGSRALEMKFNQGSTIAVNGGAMRHKFAESESVYLRYRVRYSSNWVGSGQSYHPHEFHFLTNEDDDWVGPSFTRLTLYIEHNYRQDGGYPLLITQDGRNIDQSRIGQNLTNTTEQRAVSGCNGNSDGHPTGCYQSSPGQYNNSKTFSASEPAFLPAAGAGYKGDWHTVEAYFEMNTIENGKGVPNGTVRYWFDGKLLIDRTNVLLRTGARPNQKFNQFMIAYYIGSGSPVNQTVWVDDLMVASRRN